MTVPTLPRTTLAPGLEVSALGFGGMALTHVYGDVDPDTALATLHHVIDTGTTFLDTADVYGKPAPGQTGPSGANEELVGRLLAERRDEVEIATKFGITGRIGEHPEHLGDPA